MAIPSLSSDLALPSRPLKSLPGLLWAGGEASTALSASSCWTLTAEFVLPVKQRRQISRARDMSSAILSPPFWIPQHLACASHRAGLQRMPTEGLSGQKMRGKEALGRNWGLTFQQTKAEIGGVGA